MGIPGFLVRRFSLEIRHFLGIQVQASAVKVDGDLHVLPIAETKGVFFTVSILELSPSATAFVIR
jgi:hypothetical protein